MLGETGDDQVVRDALPDLRHQLGLFDEQLAGTRHLAGDGFSAADAYLAPILAYVAQTPEADTLLGEAPNLKRWWDAMQARESFTATAP
jgi:glutathione S-transferase